MRSPAATRSSSTPTQVVRSYPALSTVPQDALLSSAANDYTVGRASPQASLSLQVGNCRVRTSRRTATRIRSDDTASFGPLPGGASAPSDFDGRLGLYS